MQIDGTGPIIPSQNIFQKPDADAAGVPLPADAVSLSGQNGASKKRIFYSTLNVSKPFVSNVIAGNHAVSGSWGLGIRREHTGITFPVGAPFVRPDGSVAVMGRNECVTISGKDFQVASKSTFENRSTSPYYYAPAFREDGTACFVSEDQKNLCIYKDSVKSIPNLNDESITTPVVISDEGIAYGDRDGRIAVVDFDGRQVRSHGISMMFSTAVSAPDGPERVMPGKEGRLYVTTGDKRIFCFRPDGSKWETALTGKEPLRLQESTDGTTLYAGAGRQLVALSTADGKEKWSVPLKGDSHWDAVSDGNGILYVYAAGEVTRVSPDGVKTGSFGTGVKKPWYGATRIAIDGNGNICLNVNHREFHVYTPEGTPIIRLSNKDIFGNDGMIGDFSITPEGNRALITGKEGDIAEVSLPESLEKRIYSYETEQANCPSADNTILQEEETVWIAGVSLAKRAALAQSLLPFLPVTRPS